jgi:dynein heavy chain 1
VDLEVDQQVLDSFVTRLFTPRAYDVGFELVKGLPAPDSRTLDSFVAWARSALPETGEHPALLNLPPLSAAFVATSRGEALLTALRKMQSREDDERVSSVSPSAASPSSSTARPAWMTSVLRQAQAFHSALPQSPVLADTKGDPSKPLRRFFAREAIVLRDLLGLVRADLSAVVAACNGAKQTNHVRQLLSDLSKGASARPHPLVPG